MAVRPIFIPGENKPGVMKRNTEFQWYSGFAVSQKKKSIDSLHKSFTSDFPNKKVLEISSKSTEPLGIKLSAFNLTKYVPETGKSIPLECVFQGGKVFTGGGPFTDMYNISPRDAKRDPQLRSSGMLRAFYFHEREFPLKPTTAFYDWLYINALSEHPELSEELLKYDAFTDIEFNPEKSLNCQAASAALYVSLAKNNMLSACRDFDTFMEVIGGK